MVHSLERDLAPKNTVEEINYLPRIEEKGDLRKIKYSINMADFVDLF